MYNLYSDNDIKYNEDIIISKTYSHKSICEPERCIRCGATVYERLRYCDKCSLVVATDGLVELIYGEIVSQHNRFTVNLCL